MSVPVEVLFTECENSPDYFEFLVGRLLTDIHRTYKNSGCEMHQGDIDRVVEILCSFKDKLPPQPPH